MDMSQYDRWRQALTLLKIIAVGESEAAAGHLVSQEEAFQSAEDIIRRAESNERGLGPGPPVRSR